MCHANSTLWRERSLTMTELPLFANNGQMLLWLLENSLITQHWALRSLARVVPPQKWSPPSKWSPPPKWPPITTEMIPAVTPEMIPGISGMELRGLQNLDNNSVRAFYLFILHLFTVCNLPFNALYFAVNWFFFGLTLDITCSKDAIHLCLLFLRIFFLIFLQENLLNKIVLKQNKSNLAKLVVICSSLFKADLCSSLKKC